MDMEALSQEESLRLLAGVPVGRIVFTVRALPAVRPVNFILDDDRVIIRTGPGSKVTAAVRNAIVAFQADEIDANTHTGWSVTITGRAREIRDPDEIARLRGLLHPWADGEREHFIQIPAEIVTGRRLTASAVLAATAD